MDLTIFYKECEMNLRQLAICSISTSIPKDKIYRRRLKFLVKFIQMIFISFDVICSICSKKLLNGIDSCPECKRISPSIKSKVTKIFNCMHF